jgi:hypothetical protein
MLLASESESDFSTWLEALELTMDAYLDIYSSPKGWHEKAAAQAAFVEEQDRLTGRAQRMFSMLRNRGPAVHGGLVGVSS